MLLPMLLACWYSITSWSGRAMGSLRRRIWSISVKMAVFAPIPSASDRIATTANSGLRRRPRSANRRSEKVAIPGLDGLGSALVYLLDNASARTHEYCGYKTEGAADDPTNRRGSV